MFARIEQHPWSLLIVLLIVILLFGWKRLPDAARSIGRSMRIFKSEMSEMKSEGKNGTGAAGETVEGETLTEQQAAAAEARRKAADARAAAERAEAEAAQAERAANGSTRL